jgi:hypothetical protein
MDISNSSIRNQAYYDNPVKQSYAEFFDRAVKDPIASQKEGRPVFVNKTYVRIIKPTKPRDHMEFPATEQYRTLYRQAWEQYERTNRMAADYSCRGRQPSASRYFDAGASD